MGAQPTYFVAPNGTPLWLQGKNHDGMWSGTVEVDADVLRSSDRFPPDWPMTDFSKSEYLKYMQMDRTTTAQVYFRATRRNDDLERQILEGIGVRHLGSPVWWVDIDRGPVQAATLLDLAKLPQKSQPWTLGRGKRKRGVWLMSLEQWDNAQYPPESQGGPPFIPHVSVARDRRRKAKKTRGRRRG